MKESGAGLWLAIGVGCFYYLLWTVNKGKIRSWINGKLDRERYKASGSSASGFGGGYVSQDPREKAGSGSGREVREEDRSQGKICPRVSKLPQAQVDTIHRYEPDSLCGDVVCMVCGRLPGGKWHI